MSHHRNIYIQYAKANTIYLHVLFFLITLPRQSAVYAIKWCDSLARMWYLVEYLILIHHVWSVHTSGLRLWIVSLVLGTHNKCGD